MLTKETKQKLSKLAQFLDKKVPADRFNLVEWWIHTPGCGTVGCAVGWACQIPEFKKEGLKLLNNCSPCYNSLTSWSGVASFFNLNMEEATYLFLGSAYLYNKQKKTHVIKRIREFVKTNGKIN